MRAPDGDSPVDPLRVRPPGIDGRVRSCFPGWIPGTERFRSTKDLARIILDTPSNKPWNVPTPILCSEYALEPHPTKDRHLPRGLDRSTTDVATFRSVRCNALGFSVSLSWGGTPGRLPGSLQASRLVKGIHPKQASTTSCFDEDKRISRGKGMILAEETIRMRGSRP